MDDYAILGFLAVLVVGFAVSKYFRDKKKNREDYRGSGEYRNSDEYRNRPKFPRGDQEER